MGFPTKVQLIKRKESEQWYINFPSAVAQAMEFERGETVVPDRIGEVVPFHAGETLGWRLV